MHEPIFTKEEKRALEELIMEFQKDILEFGAALDAWRLLLIEASERGLVSSDLAQHFSQFHERRNELISERMIAIEKDSPSYAARLDRGRDEPDSEQQKSPPIP